MMKSLGSMLGLVALVGCGDGVPPRDLDGVYEVVERLEGACDGELEPSTVSPGDRYFELEYTEDPIRLEYHTCTSADSCSRETDQARSFGPSGSNWNGTLATSSTGCVLRYRIRELFPTDEGVEIIQTTYGETDDSLVGDAECNDREARDRARRMPCLSVVETRATQL